ncbi:MAG: response regulator transcription factor [Candidatus Promineifilaceae bacterium]|nr:response regulator transcription factor [Candidatus Promineifilaceae bacterium]
MESGQKQYKVLAVDDNLYTLRIVKQSLSPAGYRVTTVSSGEEGLNVISDTGLPHLAIVDLHMPPGMSGFEFCRSIHQYSDVPVIMLTAVGEESTVLEGLEHHAEDYIVKPFSPGELVARVSRLIKRMGEFEFPLEAFTPVDEHLQINFPHRYALVDGEPVSLTPTETKLLYILMRSAGNIVTTEYILRRLWPSEPAFEDRLHVHLHRLRRKLEPGGFKGESTYIVSERGSGYMFAKSFVS